MSGINKILQNYTPLKRIILHLFFWGCLLAMYIVLYSRFDSSKAWLLAAKELLAVTTIFYATSYIIIPKYLMNGKYFICFVWFIIIYSWWGLLTYLTCLELELYVHTSQRMHMYINKVLEIGLIGLFRFSTLSFYFLDFIYFISLPLGIKLTQAIFDIRNQKLKLEFANAELALNNLKLEISFLKSQINPHFLFNTINNIIFLVIDDPLRAESSLTQLGSIMNYLVYESDKSFVLLNSELAFLKNYIELEKLRLSDKVKIDINISSDSNNYLIVPVIIFSFVENAFKHGPLTSSKNAWVHVYIEAKNGKLKMKVSNSFKRLSKPEGYVGGIGVENVRKRLELNYEKYDLQIKENEAVYDVILKIDLLCNPPINE